MNNSQSINVLLKLLITVLVVGLFVGKILAYCYPLHSLPNEWIYAGIFVGLPTGIVISIAIFLRNSFKLFGFKRKLEVFSFVEGFFELHSTATERKKDKNRAENSNFLAN